MIHLYALLVGIASVSLVIGILYLLSLLNISIETMFIFILIATVVLLFAYLSGSLILEGMFGIRLV